MRKRKKSRTEQLFLMKTDMVTGGDQASEARSSILSRVTAALPAVSSATA